MRDTREAAMLLPLVTRELQSILSDKTLRFSILVLTVVTPLSAYTQARYYQRVTEERFVRGVIHREENSTVRLVISRETPSLLPFFNGIYDYLPEEVVVHSQASSNAPSSEDLNPLDQFFPKADLSLVVGVLMTLMAVLLGHNVVAGDREQAALRFVLSYPIKRSTVLAAKLTTICIVILAGVAYAIGLYTIIVTTCSGGAFHLTAAAVREIAVVFSICFLTVALFAALSVAMSTILRNSSVALTGGVAFWVVALFIWPSVAGYLARGLWPLQSKQSFDRRMVAEEKRLVEAELDDHRRAAAELEARHADVETSWRRYQDLNGYWRTRKWAEMKELTAEYETQLRRRQFGATMISLVSPYGAFKAGLSEVSGAGLNDYHEFVDAAEKYGAEVFIPAALEFGRHNKPWIRTSELTEKFEPEPFSLPVPTLAGRLKRSAPAITAQIVEIAGLLLLAFLKFERYRFGPRVTA